MITEVFTDAPIGSAGSPADQWSADNANIVSATLVADTLPGLFVTKGTVDKTAELINDDDDVLLGLVVKADHLATPSQIDADGVIQSGVTVAIAKTGRFCVYIPGAFAPGTQAHVRFTADTEGPVGSIQGAADSGKTRPITRGAVEFVTSGTDEVGVIEINIALDHAAAVAVDS